MDLPLYIIVSRTSLSDIGSAAYQLFDHAVVLDKPVRQSGQDSDQVLFRDILLRLRNGQTTETDWMHLMERIASKVHDLTPFQSALHLHPTTENTTCPNYMPVVNLWPPSELSTLVPMLPKHHLMVQEDCTPSSASPKEKGHAHI